MQSESEMTGTGAVCHPEWLAEGWHCEWCGGGLGVNVRVLRRRRIEIQNFDGTVLGHLQSQFFLTMSAIIAHILRRWVQWPGNYVRFMAGQECFRQGSDRLLREVDPMAEVLVIVVVKLSVPETFPARGPQNYDGSCLCDSGNCCCSGRARICNHFGLFFDRWSNACQSCGCNDDCRLGVCDHECCARIWHIDHCDARW